MKVLTQTRFNPLDESKSRNVINNNCNGFTNINFEIKNLYTNIFYNCFPKEKESKIIAPKRKGKIIPSKRKGKII